MKPMSHTMAVLDCIGIANEAESKGDDPEWAPVSVHMLLAAGYVEKREDGIWITDAGRAALREHQEGEG